VLARVIDRSGAIRASDHRAALRGFGLPLLGGLVVALSVALVSEKLHPVWIALGSAGLLALLPAFVVKDASTYWIGLFLAVLPLNITKIFITEPRAVQTVESIGATWGFIAPILQLADLPLAAAGGLWLLRVADRRSQFVFPRIGYLALGFLTWATIGALFAPRPSLAFFELLREYKLFLLFLFTVNVVNPQRMGKLIMIVLLSGAVMQSALTLVRFGTQRTGNVFGQAFGSYEDPFVSRVNEDEHSPPNDATLRGFGTLRHPNVTAMHLLLTLPVAMAVGLTGRTARTRWFNGAIFLLGLAAVGATVSRGGMIGLLVGGTVVLIVAMTAGRIRHRLVAGVVLASLLTSVVLLAPLFVYTRSGAAAVHVQMIETGARISQVNPITGTGLNNSNAFRRSFSNETNTELRFPLHNYYLLILSETGLVGFALYFGFFGIILWRSIKLGRSPDFETGAFGLGLAGAFVALGVQLMVDYPYLDALQMFLWFYAGLVVALGRRPSGALNDGGNSLALA
jgi:hypothetical protein